MRTFTQQACDLHRRSISHKGSQQATASQEHQRHAWHASVHTCTRTLAHACTHTHTHVHAGMGHDLDKHCLVEGIPNPLNKMDELVGSRFLVHFTNNPKCILSGWKLIRDFIEMRAKLKEKPGMGALDGSVFHKMDLSKPVGKLNAAELSTNAILGHMVSDPMEVAAKLAEGAFDRYLQDLRLAAQVRLREWSKDASNLYEGLESMRDVALRVPVQQFPPVLAGVYTFINNNGLKEIVVDMLQAACAGALPVWEDHTSEWLPGGRFYNCSDELRAENRGMPVHTLAAERLMGLCKDSDKRCPNITIHVQEAMIAWTVGSNPTHRINTLEINSTLFVGHMFYCKLLGEFFFQTLAVILCKRTIQREIESFSQLRLRQWSCVPRRATNAIS